MSRKALFVNLLGAKAESPESPVEEAAGRSARLRTRPLLGAPELIKDPSASPVGALSKSLSEFKAQADRAAGIEKQLAEGLAVIEIDPALIDPSFVSDRFGAAEETHRTLVEAIREHGQQVPILVRPHPLQPGRYQVAYGHRRLRAAAELARPVRAVVRDLTDEALVVAQGQENNERQDLSFIEKARFARHLEERGFRRDTIMSALSVYKSDLSNMLSVVAKIPADFIEAIGPAPSIGRRGWIEIADLLVDGGAQNALRNAVTDPDFRSADSDGRFRRAMAAIKPTAEKATVEHWTQRDGMKVVKVAKSEEKISLTIDRRKAPEFSDFLLERLASLYEEFKARQ